MSQDEKPEETISRIIAGSATLGKGRRETPNGAVYTAPFEKGQERTLCYGVPALDKTNQDHDYRDNKQEVDKSTERVRGYKTECPENNENYGDSDEHR